MNRITRGLKHSWQIKRKQNCYSGILFTLFTCFVSSLFTKKSLVVHWRTKLYVLNDNFKYIPEFFLLLLLLQTSGDFVCVNQDYNKIQHFMTAKFQISRSSQSRQNSRFCGNYLAVIFFSSINKCAGCCISCFFVLFFLL